MENQGRIVACDIVPAKLDALARQCARTGVRIVDPRPIAAAHLEAAVPGGADRVLVDAPCSGLGVLRRRPEIKWRLRPEDLPGLAARQLEILEGAAGAVRPGGTLVLAVCSLEPEEGPEVAARFLGAHAGFEPVPITGWPPGTGGAPVPAALPAGPGAALLSPHRHDTDGFFVAVFRRRTP